MRVLVFTLVLLGAVSSATDAHATRLKTLTNGYCVSVDAGYPLTTGVLSGTGLATKTCDDDNPLLVWESGAVGDGFFVRAAVDANGATLCIDVPNAVPSSGQEVQLYGCNQTQAQLWRPIVDLTDGTIRLASSVTQDNEWCLSADTSGELGLRLTMASCSATNDAQRFVLD